MAFSDEKVIFPIIILTIPFDYINHLPITAKRLIQPYFRLHQWLKKENGGKQSNAQLMECFVCQQITQSKK